MLLPQPSGILPAFFQSRFIRSIHGIPVAHIAVSIAGGQSSHIPAADHRMGFLPVCQKIEHSTFRFHKAAGVMPPKFQSRNQPSCGKIIILQSQILPFPVRNNGAVAFRQKEAGIPVIPGMQLKHFPAIAKNHLSQHTLRPERIEPTSSGSQHNIVGHATLHRAGFRIQEQGFHPALFIHDRHADNGILHQQIFRKLIPEPHFLHQPGDPGGQIHDPQALMGAEVEFTLIPGQKRIALDILRHCQPADLLQGSIQGDQFPVAVIVIDHSVFGNPQTGRIGGNKNIQLLFCNRVQILAGEPGKDRAAVAGENQHILAHSANGPNFPQVLGIFPNRSTGGQFQGTVRFIAARRLRRRLSDYGNRFCGFRLLGCAAAKQQASQNGA